MHQTPCPITGKWGSWTRWSSCNADCGGGTKKRRRECNRPLQLPLPLPSIHCEGHPDETVICNLQSCSTNPPPVDGGWSLWTPWTSCNAVCGDGTKTRSRECNQPPPSDGGAFCRGSSDEKARCNMDNERCGPHSVCSVEDNKAVCHCQQGFLGSPPNCRPECTQNSDCPSHKACVR